MSLSLNRAERRDISKGGEMVRTEVGEVVEVALGNTREIRRIV